MSLIDILVKGGWLMIPIFLASLAVIAIGGGRYLILRGSRAGLREFLSQWQAPPAAPDPARYRAACKMGPSFLYDMADAIPPDKTGADFSEKIENIGQGELHEMEKG